MEENKSRLEYYDNIAWLSSNVETVLTTGAIFVRSVGTFRRWGKKKRQSFIWIENCKIVKNWNDGNVYVVCES